MKVIYADNWKERMERCEKINRANEQRMNILRICCSIVMLALHMSLWDNVINKGYDITLLVRIIYITSPVLFVLTGWYLLTQIVATAMDYLIICKGCRPIFKQVADIGATFSYLIAEKGATATLRYLTVIVEYKEKNRKKDKTLTYHLSELKHKELSSIEEPTLNLQDLELLLPKGYEENLLKEGF